MAIPVDENNTNTNVCVSFGRAPYFFIYENETKENVSFGNRDKMLLCLSTKQRYEELKKRLVE